MVDPLTDLEIDVQSFDITALSGYTVTSRNAVVDEGMVQ